MFSIDWLWVPQCQGHPEASWRLILVSGFSFEASVGDWKRKTEKRNAGRSKMQNASKTAWLVNAEKACMESQTVYFTSRLVLNRISDEQVLQYIGWQWCSFIPYLCQLVFAAILWVKLNFTLMSLKYPLLVGWWYVDIFLNQLTKFPLNGEYSLISSTQYVMLYPQMAIVSWP